MTTEDSHAPGPRHHAPVGLTARRDRARHRSRAISALTVLLVAAGACGNSDSRIAVDAVTPTSTVAAGPSAATTTQRSIYASAATRPAGPAPATGPSVVTTTPSAPPGEFDPSPLVTWNGKPQYIHGANLPWYNFGRDFGGGPDGGASSAEVRSAVGAALRKARDAGMNSVRWWLFPGEASQFTVDARGLPTGFTEAVYQDIDAALELARTNRIAYAFTIFSGPTHFPPAWLHTEEGRQRVALVLRGLFARYRDHPQIMTWDVINEPEFEVWSGAVSADAVRAFIAGIVDAAHAATSVPVTVGGARMDGIPMLMGLGLDYYTVHWYDPMTSRADCLICVTYADVRDGFKVIEPIVVGEYYSPVGFGDRFELWRAKGFAGTMPWSLLPDRTADLFSIDLAAATAFAEQQGLR